MMNVFRQNGKRPMQYQFTQKVHKQILKNYRPVSLLPICARIFQRIIYNRIFEYLIENNLTTENQFGLKPGDSCINQLLSIIHDICNLSTRTQLNKHMKSSLVILKNHSIFHLTLTIQMSNKLPFKNI